MLNGAISRRYAKAIFEIALANNSVDTLEKELKGIVAALGQSPDFKRILFHPQIEANEKKALINKIFTGQLSTTALNFIEFLVVKRREEYLHNIVDRFVVLANEHRNIVEAKVTTAVELSAEEISQLTNSLSKLTGKTVQLSTVVDATIIGGVIVRIGDTVIDGSIVNKLNSLKQTLKHIQVKEIGVSQ
jgi:F-type H+-transporting ATPase subunit delta